MSTTTHTDLLRSTQEPRPWLLGAPHLAIALLTWPLLGSAAFVSGLLLAALASFIVYLPLTALALNRGRPIVEDEAPPALTPMAQLALLVLWTATAWGAALAVGLR